jgi:uncharacterized membrane protein YkvA (DUF1232 family)
MRDPASAPVGVRERIRRWVRLIRKEIATLWFACRHPACPVVVKVLCVFVVAYALSPIDLIPDFIPVLGYLDEVLLLPALIWLALRLLPTELARESREMAESWVSARDRGPMGIAGAVLIVLLWIAITLGVWHAWQG